MPSLKYDIEKIKSTRFVIDTNIDELLEDSIKLLSKSKRKFPSGNNIINQFSDIQFYFEGLSGALLKTIESLEILDATEGYEPNTNYIEMPDYTSMSKYTRSPETEALVNDIYNQIVTNDSLPDANKIAVISALSLVELVGYRSTSMGYYFGEGWKTGSEPEGFDNFGRGTASWGEIDKYGKEAGLHCVGLPLYAVAQSSYELGGVTPDEMYAASKAYGAGDEENWIPISEGELQEGDILRNQGHLAFYIGEDSNGTKYVAESSNNTAYNDFEGVRIIEYNPKAYSHIIKPKVYSMVDQDANIQWDLESPEGQTMEQIESYAADLKNPKAASATHPYRSLNTPSPAKTETAPFAAEPTGTPQSSSTPKTSSYSRSSSYSQPSATPAASAAPTQTASPTQVDNVVNTGETVTQSQPEKIAIKVETPSNIYKSSPSTQAYNSTSSYNSEPTETPIVDTLTDDSNIIEVTPPEDVVPSTQETLNNTEDTYIPVGEPTSEEGNNINAALYMAGGTAAAAGGYFGYKKIKERQEEKSYEDDDDEYPEDDNTEYDVMDGSATIAEPSQNVVGPR